MRSEESGDTNAYPFSATTFDGLWEPVEDAHDADDYLYRFLTTTDDAIDSGNDLVELPRVGMRVHLGPNLAESVEYVVGKIQDETFTPSSGGQPRVDMWVSSVASVT